MFFKENKKLIAILLALAAPLCASQSSEKKSTVEQFFNQGTSRMEFFDFAKKTKVLDAEMLKAVFDELDIDRSIVNSSIMKNETTGENYRAVTILCHYKNLLTDQRLPKVICGRINIAKEIQP